MRSFVVHSATAILLLVLGTAKCWAAPQGSGIAPCGIRYKSSSLTSLAHALISPATGEPVILYSPNFIVAMERRAKGQGAAIFRYLMQHECAHHTLGHVSAAAANPTAVVSVRTRLELAADCHAAEQLGSLGDEEALRAALMLWNGMGETPTGPGYPTGLERAQKLLSCYGAVVAARPGF